MAKSQSIVPRVPTNTAAQSKPRRLTQRFFLDDDVEVTIKFAPGTARWTSTQSTVAISSGKMDPPLPPSASASALSRASSPARESWSNCDDRGLGFTQGSGDPLQALREGVPAIAASSVNFLDRVESSVNASEGVTNEELEGEILSGMPDGESGGVVDA